ncbi:NUDIX hydrolase [Nonomuraea sp. MG754425]|uniref:NUDIX hydrolase n=1 Tax=Nonomuraea sp. MG754425 TaxID=2570319 RepID=UPI001F2B8B24|nr:NUDIX hydrolase [Nonomuraea sp. MG754425]MCF6467435.1 NUDIX hydrolase [Nonomuraea sp. MG754425]
MKVCDNASVGALIFDKDGRLLVFDRNTDPPGVAGPAGHIDHHGGPMDAVCAEVFEEVGLTVAMAELVTGGWRPNRCRRLPGPRGVGHQWQIFRVEVAGELNPSRRETRNARWLRLDELQTQTTLAYARGHLTAGEFRDRPGLEPVWVQWLTDADLVEVSRDDLVVLDQLAANPHDERKIG